MKCMQVNGIIIDEEVKFVATHEGQEYLFKFVPYLKYVQYNLDLINPEIIGKCGTVVVYDSMGIIVWRYIILKFLFHCFILRIELK